MFIADILISMRMECDCAKGHDHLKCLKSTNISCIKISSITNHIDKKTCIINPRL